VGRYLLQPGIFAALRALKEQGNHPLELTAGIELLRQQGDRVFGLELSGKRQDVGEIVAEAGALLGAWAPSSEGP
jgi:UTP-glucose-1-phosphate uridylyltransferase